MQALESLLQLLSICRLHTKLKVQGSERVFDDKSADGQASYARFKRFSSRVPITFKRASAPFTASYSQCIIFARALEQCRTLKASRWLLSVPLYDRHAFSDH